MVVRSEGRIQRIIDVLPQFSLRGRWPAERYQKILDIQLYVARSAVIRDIPPEPPRL